MKAIAPVLIAIAALLLGVVGLSLILRQPAPLIPAKTPLPIHVAYPILLIHGLGSSSDIWTDRELVRYFEDRGLTYGGVLKRRSDGDMSVVRSGKSGSADFFAIEISDKDASLRLWARDVDAAIDAILRATGAPRVVLVGHSAGGVAARLHVVDQGEGHRTARLVTIASPHRGSELATIALLPRQLEELAATTEGVLGTGYAALASTARTLLSNIGPIDLEAPLLRDLAPEEYSDLLRDLNQRSHPTSLDYACVVTIGRQEIDSLTSLLEEIQQLLAGDPDSQLLARLNTTIMGLIRLLQRKTWDPGDGAVLVDSQDLRQLPPLRNDPTLKLEVLTVDELHSEILSRHDVIVDAIAGDTDIRAARLRPRSAGLEIEIEFFHYFAGLCALEIHLDGLAAPLSPATPQIYRQDEQTIAQVEVPWPADASRAGFRVVTHCLGDQHPVGRRVVFGTADPTLSAASEETRFPDVRWQPPLFID